MRTRISTFRVSAAVLTCTALSLASIQALAAEYWLRVAATTVGMPDNGGATVPIAMWGYAKCTPAYATCSDSISIPGPVLTVPSTETELTVHLRNDLMVPTSLVINGLYKKMTPVWDSGAVGPRPNQAARVRSFDEEAMPNSGEAVYTWSNVQPGTYLYQSGTQPQVQVQMGLYGAATKNQLNPVAATSTSGRAYAGTGYDFDNEATLIYSEIDPLLHAAIATGCYGPVPAATCTTPGPTSTINYAPKYFLINGQPYQFGASVIEPVGSQGTTLLRLINAGLTTHVPMIKGKHWDVIAEDGKPYPYRRTQYTALLPAAKTVDVLLKPDLGTTYPILDRRLSLSNNGFSDGGMLAFLRVGSLGVGSAAGANAAPFANDDVFDSIPGVTFTVPAPGVLNGDTDSDNPIIKVVAVNGETTGIGIGGKKGTYTLNANGSFTYSPAPGFTGDTDTFTYQAYDGQALSNVATVTIRLIPPTVPGLGSPLDGFAVDGASLGASWSQQAATGPAVPDIGISGGMAVANTTSLGGLAIWNAASFGLTQTASFVSGGPPASGAYLVLKATGGSATAAPVNYVRVGCEAGQIVVSTLMGGSNVSTYTKQAAFGSCSGSGVLSAVVDAKGLVTVFQSQVFVGGVQLPDVAAWKGGGRIGIQLTTVGATADDFAGGTMAAP